MSNWQAAERRRADAHSAVVTAEEKLSANQTSIGDVDRMLAGLQADDAQVWQQRQVELDRQRRTCEGAEVEMRELEGELGRFPPDVSERAAVLRGRKQELDSEAARDQRALQDAEASARALLAQAPYADLAFAEERVTQLEADESQELLKLESIRLVFETVRNAKAKALDGLAEAVASTATSIAARIAGGSLAEIELDNAFQVSALRPEDAGEDVQVKEMSGGEQEQIYFATRLALADLLARDEPQILVLDDVLLNTDDVRLGRILELLKERSSRMQFVILTCHPERYDTLTAAGAQTIQIENFEVAAE